MIINILRKYLFNLKRKKEKTPLKELKEFYGIASGKIINEAIQIKGCTKKEFRRIVKGKNLNKKPVDNQNIIDTLNILKQAYINISKKEHKIL